MILRAGSHSRGSKKKKKKEKEEKAKKECCRALVHASFAPSLSFKQRSL